MPPAASWSVPISVGVDQLRPYTAYLFEVSAFTSDGEGQIASTMVRMPESGMTRRGSRACLQLKFLVNIHVFFLNRYWLCVSAPEDPPQNFFILNMTSRSISVSWNSPSIITGKFTYMLYIYGPTGESKFP